MTFFRKLRALFSPHYTVTTITREEFEKLWNDGLEDMKIRRTDTLQITKLTNWG